MEIFNENRKQGEGPTSKAWPSLVVLRAFHGLQDDKMRVHALFLFPGIKKICLIRMGPHCVGSRFYEGSARGRPKVLIVMLDRFSSDSRGAERRGDD